MNSSAETSFWITRYWLPPQQSLQLSLTPMHSISGYITKRKDDMDKAKAQYDAYVEERFRQKTASVLPEEERQVSQLFKAPLCWRNGCQSLTIHRIFDDFFRDPPPLVHPRRRCCTDWSRTGRWRTTTTKDSRWSRIRSTSVKRRNVWRDSWNSWREISTSSKNTTSFTWHNESYGGEFQPPVGCQMPSIHKKQWSRLP